MSDFSNRDNIIDVRDVIAREEELREEREGLQDTYLEATDALKDHIVDDWDGSKVAWDVKLSQLKEALHQAQLAINNFDERDGEELKVLTALVEELSGYATGGSMIRESHFKDYTRDYAEEIGAIERNTNWPHNCIDWDQATEELQQDYTAVEFDGVTYYVR
jgi:uncharacterized protein with von Willebrand factor type A (vWA) domain